VLRTGRPELYAELPEKMLRAAARDAEHLEIIFELDMTSAMCVPLRARGRTLGRPDARAHRVRPALHGGGPRVRR
jgi:hypothetical protein